MLAGCAVAISVAIVLLLLSARRAIERSTAMLALAGREITPLATEARGLTTDARALTQEATRELRRTGDVVDRVYDTAEGMSRLVNALAGLTRAGQVVGVAAAVRRGIDVFVHRMRKEGGNHHGQ